MTVRCYQSSEEAVYPCILKPAVGSMAGELPCNGALKQVACTGAREICETFEALSGRTCEHAALPDDSVLPV